MPTLYVIEPEARVEKEYDRILITREDEQIFRTPLRYISDVVLVGRAGITTPALHALLQADVPLILVSRTGKMLGKLQPKTGGNLALRQAQYRKNDDRLFGLQFSKSIVSGKIHNQLIFAQRLLRRRPALQMNKTITQLKQKLKEIENVNTIDSLMGIEGQAARIYFSVFRQALNPEWSFKERTRRPPRNPVNALLSLGYTFLGHAIEASLEIVGLDPYLGYFHAEKYGRPALVLDMMEEFRTPIVDSMVLDLLNHQIIKPEYYTIHNKGVTLNDEGLRLFFRRFSSKLEQLIKPRYLKRKHGISYRKVFEVQARRLSQYIMGNESSYQPFRWR